VIHLDTGFVIDLQREADDHAPAHAFLEQHRAESFAISVHALCELEAGILLTRHPERERARLHSIVGGMAVAYPDVSFAVTYARTFASLERRGKRMPVMDLLIAVAALLDEASLVTRNVKDFALVPDLNVLSY
jgi:tRNA(fMet)-specific endonuclease VapC